MLLYRTVKVLSIFQKYKFSWETYWSLIGLISRCAWSMLLKLGFICIIYNTYLCKIVHVYSHLVVNFTSLVLCTRLHRRFQWGWGLAGSPGCYTGFFLTCLKVFGYEQGGWYGSSPLTMLLIYSSSFCTIIHQGLNRGFQVVAEKQNQILPSHPRQCLCCF